MLTLRPLPRPDKNNLHVIDARTSWDSPHSLPRDAEALLPHGVKSPLRRDAMNGA
jgi:hypothetical protein